MGPIKPRVGPKGSNSLSASCRLFPVRFDQEQCHHCVLSVALVRRYCLRVGADCHLRIRVPHQILCCLTDAPFDCRRVANIRRKLCQPIFFTIPARSAAGRTCRLSTASGQYGFASMDMGLVKTQSFGLQKLVVCIHFCREAANGGPIGIGRLEASVFGGPST